MNCYRLSPRHLSSPRFLRICSIQFICLADFTEMISVVFMNCRINELFCNIIRNMQHLMQIIDIWNYGVCSHLAKSAHSPSECLSSSIIPPELHLLTKNYDWQQKCSDSNGLLRAFLRLWWRDPCSDSRNFPRK